MVSSKAAAAAASLRWWARPSTTCSSASPASQKRTAQAQRGSVLGLPGVVLAPPGHYRAGPCTQRVAVFVALIVGAAVCVTSVVILIVCVAVVAVVVRQSRKSRCHAFVATVKDPLFVREAA